jgi:hypothetical protein
MPSRLECQHLFEYGPYEDIDNSLWYKCDTKLCRKPFHLACINLTETTSKGEWFCIVCRREKAERETLGNIIIHPYVYIYIILLLL